MKNTIRLFILLTICFTSCLNDCPTCAVCDEEPEYHAFEVDFFASHGEFELRPATFETVTEQILIRPAYQEGATFVAVNEIIMTKAVHSYLEIYKSDTLHVVLNAEKNTAGEIVCFDFYEEADFVEIQMGATFETIEKFVLGKVKLINVHFG